MNTAKAFPPGRGHSSFDCAPFHVLRTGESAFQDCLLAELERASMAAAGIPRDNLFRNSSDMLGVRREPRFALAICVQNADARAVRQILEKQLEEEPQEISLEEESVSSTPGESETTTFLLSGITTSGTSA